ncbi:DUF4267 domain-containing protein [Streptomyces sp. NPDC060000]|uniref:DUF4267 domain-containing protein n=1 Tax=Streptomyces sp. NPDC060000 TaxID=3347031 RepID=UPI00369D2DB2
MSYVFTPEATAPNFGLPSWPQGDGGGFLTLKGVRDLVSGPVLLVLLTTGHRRALGWVLLAAACTPIGDMITVLAHHGRQPPPSVSTEPPRW